MWGIQALKVGGLALVYALSLLNNVLGFAIWQFESTQKSTAFGVQYQDCIAFASRIQGRYYSRGSGEHRNKGRQMEKAPKSLQMDLIASASISLPFLASSSSSPHLFPFGWSGD